MAGIVFIKTQNLRKVTDFYKKLGATLWVQQPEINILKHGNMLFGFHQQPESSKDVLLTFFYKEKRQVDEMYHECKERALAEPKENAKYKIYHFFAIDPEDRKIEFQTFLHPIVFDWN